MIFYMADMTKKVVVDSDAIFAIFNPNDPLNARATQTFQELANKGYQLIYPTSVVFEVVSLFQRVLPTPTITAKIIEMIRSDKMLVKVVDEDILKESVTLFNPAGSKKNTLIDCSVAVIAKKIKADGVFAYDEFYTKQGLTQAENLLKRSTS
jgi:predicted nucleic acid-binding protein